MSAIKLEQHDADSDGAFWRDPQRRADLMRQHALPLGLAIGVGALLRLLWLGDTSFLGDQAQLLAVGRSAADHHALIITGIPSSLGALNPPAATWLYGLFSLVGGPLVATIFTALANIIAIALVYAIAARYLGRRAACTSALLYATASGPVHYSRFIWQQNLLAPVILLLFWMILRAVVERGKNWLGWSVLLWGIATELHPTAAPLLGLIAVALAFTWRDLRRRDLAWAAVALAALFGPVALWEALSHGYDLLGAQRLGQGHATFDTWALTYLLQLTQPAPSGAYGAAAAYVPVGRGLAWLGTLVEAIVIAAQVWLVATLAAPWMSRERTVRASAHAALTDRRWRVALCLALWEALPLIFMLRHTRAVEPHYLLVLLPAVYLIVGGACAWASFWLQRALAGRAQSTMRASAIALTALVVVVGAVSVGQTIGVASELATIHSGAFDALTLPLHYGTPLSSEYDALAATQRAARQLHATVAIASTRVQQEPLGYLNATSPSSGVATDYISDGCVALPAASARAPLVTLAPPESTAAQLLPQIQGARAIASVGVKGGQPYAVYAIAPGAAITGETPISAASGASAQPQPAAYAYASKVNGHPTLIVHWTGAPAIRPNPGGEVSYWYGADPSGTPIADYTFSAQPLDAQGQPIGGPVVTVCARLAWSPQLSLVTTTRLPPALATGGRAAAWRISATMAPAVALRPTLGPLVFETGAITFGPARALGQPVTFGTP